MAANRQHRALLEISHPDQLTEAAKIRELKWWHRLLHTHCKKIRTELALRNTDNRQKNVNNKDPGSFFLEIKFVDKVRFIFGPEFEHSIRKIS